MAVIFYWVGTHLNVSDEMTREDSVTITIFQMILLSTFAGAAFGCLIGALYEVPYKLWIFQEPADMMDILRSGLGGVIGFTAACLLPNIPKPVIYVLLALLAVAFILDLIRTIKNKKNESK